MKNESKMWEHYCKIDKTTWSVEKGATCNWCGLTEEAYNSLKGDTKEFLTEEVVTAISKEKNEPRWLLDWRLGGLK